MSIRNVFKKIWLSLYNSGRIIVLDYKVIPQRLYPENQPHQALYGIIDKNRNLYRELLEYTVKFTSVYASIRQDGEAGDTMEPGWNNQHLPGLDMVMLYSLLPKLKPAKYVEIGSGTSTRVAFRSKKDNVLGFDIISIDPFPRIDVSGIVDKQYPVEVQKLGTELFGELKENDIVFFDGTHTLLPNSDVLFFFLEILPKLRKGVIVHIHDVYLPYDYPDFMCARYYNEQYLLGALLLANSDKYEVICPNYFIFCDQELNRVVDPIFHQEATRNVERHGGSFWFRVNS